ncbi:ribokinase [Microbacterium sp. ZW T5_45]|uniref:ribokinase n=1 Tax=Microbacterium sp. ZW T5_45 TaxID=3378080 RepID=UPI00385557F6
MSVIVIGSANLDTAVSVDRHPGPGETLLARDAVSGAGGKGLNQAVAVARSGADTWFVGAVGGDDAGRRLRDVLLDDGVRLRVGESARPTGTAFVMVADGGENAIVVVPGANGDESLLRREADAAVAELAQGDVVLGQLEIPLPVVRSAFRGARDRGATTILNAAPSAALPDGLLDAVDILVVNQHECLDLAGPEFSDVEAAASVLAATVPTVVVTLGEEGALLHSGGAVQRVEAFPVDTVDTTAAGDTFCGALAARLAAGDDLQVAVRFASAAAALCVQRAGASASAPTLSEIREFLAGR